MSFSPFRPLWGYVDCDITLAFENIDLSVSSPMGICRLRQQAKSTQKSPDFMRLSSVEKCQKCESHKYHITLNEFCQQKSKKTA